MLILKMANNIKKLQNVAKWQNGIYNEAWLLDHSVHGDPFGGIGEPGTGTFT